MRTIICLFLATFSFGQVLFSQPPNDICQNAINLPVNDELDIWSVFDLTGATDVDPDSGAQDCYSYSGANTIQDIWYKVTVPANGYVFIDISRNFRTTGGINFSSIEPLFEAYSGDCTNLAFITDQSGTCVWDNNNGLYYEGIPNEEIYIRVFDDQFDEEDRFTIGAVKTNESNNTSCDDAIDLTVGQSCLLENYSSNNASPYSWFKFVYPPNTAYVNFQIYPRSRKPSNYRVAVMDGDCQNINLVDNYTEHFHGILIENRAPGEIIYIRVQKHFSYDGAAFGVCLFHKENDFCAGATDLPLSGSCQPIGFTNLGSSASLNPTNNINCGYYPSGYDAWLKATIPASGNITTEFSNFDLPIASSSTASFEFYTGTCGSLNAVFCDGNEFEGQVDVTRIIQLTNLPPGQTLFIRVMNALRYQEFTACAYEEASYSNTCVLNLVKFLNIGPCDPVTNTAIADFEVHYTAPFGSDLNLNIDGKSIPLNSNPQQFTIEVPAQGQTFSHQSTSITGDCFSNTYRHFNVFTAPNSCFNGVIPNDECVDAIILNPSEDCSSNPIHNYIDATISDPALDYTCSSSTQEKEIWFSFTATSSNDLKIYIDDLDGYIFSPYLDIYTGTCNNLSSISNPSCDRGYPTWDEITLANLHVGEQVFIRLLNCCSQGQGTFKICVIEECPSILDITDPLQTKQYLYKASIEVNGYEHIENNATVHFQGTESVNLYPGFEVKINSVFEANLFGCN